MTSLRRTHVIVAGIVVGVVAVMAIVAIRYWPFWSHPSQTDPNGSRPPPIRFTDVTAAAGIHFRHTSGATPQKLLPETMGSGVAVLDFDRDGRPDLFFVNSRPWPGQSSPHAPIGVLYRNRGDVTFEDVTRAYGLDIELYGMGVAAGDYDGDGWPDLFITAVGGNRLFHNVEGKRFENVTATVGLGASTQLPAVRFDEFLKHTEPISFPSSAVFLDYDGDGRLDLFVCNYLTWSPALDIGVQAVLPGGKRAYVPPQQFAGAQCALYRNVGGKFEDVSASAGIYVSEQMGGDQLPRPIGKALGVVVCDADDDGWPDLVVANDTVRNFFFHNVPDAKGGRRFEEIGLFAGLAYADGRPRGGMGIDAGEIHPHTLGIAIANFSNEPSSLFRRTATNPIRFSDVAAEVGLAGASRYPMKFGAFFFDCDRDGRLDLFTANGHLEPDIATAQPGQTYPQPGHLFWNTGEWNSLFIPAAEDAFPATVGRGCAYLDYDADGDLDLVVTENNGPARLFRNDTETKNHWARFVLAGKTNREAIGAIIEIESNGIVQRRYLTGSHGYLSQSELAVTFGLGGAAGVDRVTVRWPGRTGAKQDWHKLESGRTYALEEGVSEARPVVTGK
jgi:hypothetical protein